MPGYVGVADQGDKRQKGQRPDRHVQRPGKVPPPGAPEGQGRVPERFRFPRGKRLRRGLGRSKPVRIQFPVAHPRVPDGPAGVLVPGGPGLLAFQFSQTAGQGIGQLALTGLQRADLLQRHPQAAQQLDPLQFGQIRLGVIPVAVGLPGRMDQPFLFIIIHGGPVHADRIQQFPDGHADSPLLFCFQHTL